MSIEESYVMAAEEAVTKDYEPKNIFLTGGAGAYLLNNIG